MKRERAIAELWRRGEVLWKLHSGQQRVTQALQDSRGQIFVVLISRQWGKSFWNCCMAIQTCLKMEGAQVRYCAPTAKMVRKIILPLMRGILKDCPDDMLPEYRTIDNTFTFPTTGSQIHIVGLDKGNAESARGVGSDLIIVDESGFVDDLRYIVESVLRPQTIHTGGMVVLTSTPPKSPAHDMVGYVTQAKAEGCLGPTMTIRDNPLLSESQIARLIEEAGGIESTDCRRELFAEIVTDEESAVVPEFQQHREHVVEDIPRPSEFEHLQRYVAMDVGFDDLTAVLFGYYHFSRGCLIVEDELVLQRANTAEIATALRDKEQALWGPLRPRMRVSDVDKRLVADLANLHGLEFGTARKDNKAAAVNNLRVMIRQDQFRVHPRCTQTIDQLHYAVWNKRRTAYARMPGMGHFDCVDAAVYLARHADTKTNPIPAQFTTKEGTFVHPRTLIEEQKQRKRYGDMSGRNMLLRAMGAK